MRKIDRTISVSFAKRLNQAITEEQAQNPSKDIVPEMYFALSILIKEIKSRLNHD